MTVPSARVRPNPFPGLRPFRSDEHHVFFGREEQTAALLQLLRTNRFLAVVGTSGSGKSSLVRAGLIAELHGGTMTRAGSTWEVMILRPGGSPVENLARAFVEADLYDRDDPGTLPRLLATLNRSRFGLVEAMKQCDLFEPGSNLLVVVDQFEELFRFRQQSVDSEEMAAAFVNLLLTASEQAECPIYVAITMRSDYLGDCSEIPGLAEAVNEGEYLIPRLQRDQKREAIEKPIGVGGAKIAPMLVQRLLNEVGDDPDQLPVLQHALMRMWDAWAARGEDSRPIDFEDFDATGGLASALSNHADEIYDALPSESHRAACEKIFKTLTEKGEDNRGIRRPTRLARLTAIAAADKLTVTTILDAFRGTGVTFLMPGNEVELADGTVLDLSHESLMRNWRRLYSWVEDEAQSARIFRRLLDTARLWDSGKAGLFRDPDLQIAISWRDAESPNTEWAELYGGDFAEAIAFLETSHSAVKAEEEAKEAARERELEQARRLAEAQQWRLEQQKLAAQKLRKTIAGLAAIAAIALVACFAALISNGRANRLADVARQNESKAETNALLATRSEQAAADALAVVASQKAAVEESLSKAEQAEENSRKILYTTDMRLAPFVWSDDRSPAEQLRVLLAKHVPVASPAKEEERIAAARPDLRGFEWNYYQHLLENSATIFTGHGASVRGAAFTSGGRLTTLDENGQVRRWEVESQQEDDTGRHDLAGGPAAGAFILSPDGQRVAQLEGNRLRVFDTSSGVEAFQIDSVDSSFRSVIFSSDAERIVVVDDKIRWFGAANGELIATRDERLDRVTSLASSADGLVLAVVGTGAYGLLSSTYRADPADQSVAVLASGIQSASGTLGASAMSPSGERLAIGMSLAGGLFVLDVAKGRPIARHTSAHASPISAVAFSDDGTRLATADGEGTIKIWNDLEKLNAKSVAQLTLKGHQGAIKFLQFSRDGKQLVSGSDDKTARIWDLENAGASIRSLERGGPSHMTRLSADGRLIAAAIGSSGVRIWDASTGRLVRELPAVEQNSTISIAFSPSNDSLLAVGCGSTSGASYIGLWDIHAGTELARLSGRMDGDQSAGVPHAIEFSSDGQHLVVGRGFMNVLTPSSSSKLLEVWEVASRQMIRRLPGHVNDCVSFDFTHDGTLLATGSRDGTAIIWSTAAWAPVRTLRNPDPDTVFEQPGAAGMVEGVAFSPDGTLLAMASRGGSVLLWDVGTGQLLETLKGHSSAVEAVAFSPDGRTLASGGGDQTVRLWNVETRRELLQLNPGNVELNQIGLLTFSPDGKRLLVGGGQSTAFWSAETVVWNDTERAAETLRGLLRSSADFRSRMRMFSNNLRLHEALTKLDPQEPGVAAALAAAQANWHASREAWPEATEAFNRLRVIDPAPESWMRTPVLLRVATALLKQGRPSDAAALLSGGARRRHEDGLAAISNSISFGFTFSNANNEVWIQALMPGSPAAQSPMREGDLILKVNDAELNPDNIARFSDLVGGPAGTKVRFTVRHVGIEQPEEVELTREHFLSDPSTGDLLVALRAAVEEGLAREPKNAGLYELRAELAGQWADTEAQVADYTLAIETLAESPIDGGVEALARLQRRRGDANLVLRRWQAAADDYAGGISTESTDEALLANQALAQAELMLSGRWETLMPVQVSSKGGTILTPQADGSILPSGPNPDGEVYTVVAETTLDQIRSLRLEVLPDPSIENGSTGRGGGGGRFTLSELTASRSDQGGQGQPEPLSFTSAWSPVRGELAGKVIDGERNGPLDTFWNSAAAAKDAKLPAFVVFQVAEQKAGSGRPQVTVTLDFSSQTYKAYNLGRFRLSASSEPSAFDDEKKWFAGGLVANETMEPWAKLALAYKAAGDQAAIDRLVDRHPKSAGVVGDVYLRGQAADKDWRRAIALYSKGIAADAPDVDLLSKRARAFEELRDWDAAAADWAKAAASDPSGATLLADFARRLATAGAASSAKQAFGEAQLLFEKALQADPGNDVISERLAQLLIEKTDASQQIAWEPLRPAEMEAESGSALTVIDDGSVVIGEGSQESVRWLADSQAIEAIRIETSDRDDSITNGAPVFSEYEVIAASMAAGGAAALRGRFVRLDLPGDNERFRRVAQDQSSSPGNKTINLAEFQVFQGEQNIAFRKQARQSSGSYAPRLVPEDAVDGNTLGNDETNSYAHTDLETDPWWEVDLGSEQAIDRMVVWNRSDVGLYARMNHFRVRVLDSARKVIFERVIDQAPAPSMEIVPRAWLAEAVPAVGGEDRQLVLRLPPDMPHAAARRYRVSAAAHLADLSREDFRKHIVTGPGDAAANLALGYAANGQFEKAITHFDFALEQAEGYDARNPIFDTAATFEQITAELTKRRPNDPQLQLAQARAFAVKGKRSLEQERLADAEADLNRAREIVDRLRNATADPRWIVLAPAEMTSEGASEFTRLADGSVLTSGERPPKEVYTLTFRDLPARIEGLRIDALTDDSLPEFGPGRFDNGNFNLTGVRTQVESSTNPGVPLDLKLSRASADFVQGSDYSVAGMSDASGVLDANDETFWAIHPEVGKPHHAVIELKEPITTTDAALLRLILESKSSAAGHQLGRFRVSVPGDADGFKTLQTRIDLKDNEVAELYLAQAKTRFRQGHIAESSRLFGEAVALSTDIAFEDRIIRDVAGEEDLLQELAVRVTGDAKFQAALARHFASSGEIDSANAARTRARAVLEAKLEREPDDSSLAAELAGLLLLDTSNWIVLKPFAMKSDAGLTLAAEEDQSIFVSGAYRAKDVYTLDFGDIPRDFRTIRLEALRDERLPGGGPGTYPQLFVLSDFEMFDVDANTGSTLSPVPLGSACATFEERPAQMSLEPGESGWSIGGGAHQSQSAYFSRSGDMNELVSDRLRVLLTFSHIPVNKEPAVLGRFRLALATDPLAFKDAQRRVALMKIADPWLKLAALYAEEGETERASRLFDKALELATGDEARKHVLEIAAQYPTVFAALVERQPDDPQSQLVFARELITQGKASLAESKPAEAIVALERARDVFAQRRATYHEPKWTVLTPTKLTSSGGATLTLRPDGSILASGTNPDRGAYTILAKPPLGRVTALRLEALPDPSLPSGGPGRHESGNFHLNELRVFSGTMPCPLADIAVEYDYGREHRFVIDRRLDSKAGWSNHPHAGRPNAAVIATDFRIDANDGLKIELYFSRSRYTRHDLGRFRLSVTDDPDAFKTVAARFELKDGEVAELSLTLAKAYAANGQSDRALIAFTETVTLASDAAEYARIVSAAAPVDGLLEKLAEQCSSFVLFQAELVRHYATHGNAPLAEAAHNRARTLFDERLAEDPEDAIIAAELARFLLDVLESKKAALGKDHPRPLAWQQGLVAAPKLVDPWARLAAAYHLSDDEEALTRLLERRPAAAIGVGDLYAVAGDWGRAIAEYEKGLTKDSEDALLFTKLIAAYQSAGRSRDAVPIQAKMSAANPKDTIGSMKVAALQAWFGQEQEFADTRRRILAFAKDSNEATAVERAAKACSILPTTDRAELDAALACGRRAAQFSENNDSLRGWCLMALGMAEYRSGNDAAADEALLAAGKADPNNPSVTGISAFYRALTLFRQGKAEEARSVAIAAATQMKPLPADERNTLNESQEDLILWLAYKEAWTLLDVERTLMALLEQDQNLAVAIGEIFTARRDWEKAILAYSKGISEQTTDGGLFAKRAAAYAASGAWDSARADWLRAVQLQPDLIEQVIESLKGRERWNEAGEFALMYVEQKPDDTMRWVRSAPVLALADDPSRYHTFCARINKFFAESPTPEAADRVVKAALLRADSIEIAKLSADRLGEFLDKGAFPQGLETWGWGARALWAYRSGDAESAVRYVTKSEEYKPGELPRAMILAVLAMAQHQLQHSQEARAALDETSKLLTNLDKDPGNKANHDFLIAKMLFREAEQLIGAEKP